MTDQSSPFAAIWLRAATALLVAMPIVLWASSRSAPLLLVLVSFCLLVSSRVQGRLALDRARAKAWLGSWPALALLAFLAAAVISICWSHQPLRSLRTLAELLVPLCAGFCVVLLWPRQAPRRAFVFVAVALILGAVLIVAEIQSQMFLRRLIGTRPQSFIFNSVLISYLLIAAPVLDELLHRPDWRMRGLGLGLALTLAACLLLSESGAALFGALVGGLVFVLAMLLPRVMLVLIGFGFVASLALAPVMGTLLDTAMPQAIHQRLQSAHSRDRVDIWLSFGEAALKRPLAGAGFGTSATFAEHPVAAEVSPGHRTLLGAGHAHSLQLQIWTELGVIGAVLAALCGLTGLSVVARGEKRQRAAVLATVAGALAISTVAHGAWQAWWIAALATSICWFRAGGQVSTDQNEKSL